MDFSTIFSVAPTFPLDDAEIQKISRKHIRNSPISWGTMGLAVVAGAYLGPSFLIGLTSLAAFGLMKYWKSRRVEIDADSMLKLIDQSNREQDQELRRIIQRLDRTGQHQYALCLGRFFSLKQKIERELHTKAALKPFASQIESLVDGICIEVCREITVIREKEKTLGDVLTSRNHDELDAMESHRRKSHATILHAYTSLYSAHAGLLGLEVTASGEVKTALDASDTDRLKQMVDDLQDESELLHRLNERMSEDGVTREGFSETTFSSVCDET